MSLLTSYWLIGHLRYPLFIVFELGVKKEPNRYCFLLFIGKKSVRPSWVLSIAHLYISLFQHLCNQ